ncbi:hypothetical protein DX928_22315 [Bacillus swezeyi]|nr:hypothetical protein DX928_22315 [Bacillus swezeyi]
MAYSIIALQELNLNYRYNPLYWNTACLTVNSGGVENEEESDDPDKKKKTQKTDYGKVASAIGNIRRRGIKVDLPDINKAGFGFKADIENNSIIFGMKGMNGIGDEVVHQIISNRPYTDFEDFLERMYYSGIIKKGQVIQLIKGGCFDSFGERKDLMKSFISLISEPKSKLTMSNVKMLIENDLVPGDFALEIRLFRFKDYISKRVFKKIDSPKDKLLLLDDIASTFYNEHFDESSIVDVHNGHLVISEKAFKKEYDRKMLKLKNWIGTQEPLKKLNDCLFRQEWEKYASGSYGKWEMDSLSYYYHDHELSNVNFSKYSIVDFHKLPEEPVKGRPYKWRGKELYEYETYRIIGTALDRDKNKHTITLLTPTGVVTVKQWAGSFSHYNKQISRNINGKKEVVEKSWYTRGTLLMFTGFRRGNNFIPKTYKNSVYQHTVCKIEGVDAEGNLILTSERKQL